MTAGKVIVMTNLKGGVGKTTDTFMMTLTGASKKFFNKKILLIDVDLQANSTKLIKRTFGINSFPKSFTKAVEDGSLKPAITHVMDNLDFIAGSIGTHNLIKTILDHTKGDRDRYLFLQKMVNEIKNDYDYIFFDVAPSTGMDVDAITMTSDAVVIVQELRRMSMDGTAALITEYLQPMLDAFPEEAHFNVLGILPAILKKRRKVQLENLQETINTYGSSNVFSTIIGAHDRLENYGEYGVTLSDYEDRRMFAIYADLFSELQERIHLFDTKGDLPDDYKYHLKYQVEGTPKIRLSTLGKEISTDGFA